MNLSTTSAYYNIFKITFHATAFKFTYHEAVLINKNINRMKAYTATYSIDY